MTGNLHVALLFLIRILNQGEIRVLRVGITHSLMYRQQLTIATTHHNQVDDLESARSTVLMVGFLHQGNIIGAIKVIAS